MFRYTSLQKVISIFLLALIAHSASAGINISMTATHVLVNGIPADSTTSLAAVRRITGAEHGRFLSWDKYGCWYIYDSAGVAFRWNRDTTRLLCIATTHHAVHAPAYSPSHNMTGALSYLGAPLTTTQNIWSLLRRAAGHVVSIAPDLSSACIAHGGYDVQVTWWRAGCDPPNVKEGEPFAMLHKQRLESCIIYLCGTTDLTHHRPLTADGVRDRLYLNGRPAPDSLYAEADFVSESNPCNTDFLSVSSLGTLESRFALRDRDSISALYEFYKDYLPAHHFELSMGDESSYVEVIDEDYLNREGYSLMESGYFTAAVAVFQLNKEFHPESYNARDSYAEALLADGRISDAMFEYVFALGQNPDDDYSSRSTYYYSTRHLALILGRR